LKLPTFLHVDEKRPEAKEHPTQGASPDLKLDAQPPAQLPVMAFGSFASSRSAGDIGDADGVGVVDDVRGDTVLRATARCVGASTTTLGSEVVAPPEGVAVCDIAVPLRPHRSSAIDKRATATPATKSNEAFIAASSR
jgi:hypothetical protein